MTVLANLHNKINAMSTNRKEGTNKRRKREGTQLSLTEEFWLINVEDGKQKNYCWNTTVIIVDKIHGWILKSVGESLTNRTFAQSSSISTMNNYKGKNSNFTMERSDMPQLK